MIRSIEHINKNQKKIRKFCVLCLLIFCEFFFFRNIIGNDLMFGDRGDGRLTNLIVEHWWNFFCGNEKFSELKMFYPADGVLGYTDMLFGYGLIYSVCRAMHCNIYISFKLTLVIVHLAGTVSMYYLLYRKLKLSEDWSLFGTIAFCFSDSLARHVIHTQLMAISMMPILLIFFIGFTENFKIRKKRNIYAYLCMAWFVMMTYTSWYVAFFTGMFSLVFLIIYLIKMKRAANSIFILLRTLIKLLGYDLFLYFAFMVIAYIPFVYVYLPVFQLSSGYGYDGVSLFLPEIIDLINVTESNFLLGKWIKFLRLDDRGYSGEVTEGFSCVLLVLFLIIFVVHRKRIKEAEKCSQKITHTFLLTESIFVTIFSCILLIIRLSSNGVSLWMLVYHLLPVARSVRAISRFLLWLSFPMAVITAYCAEQYIRSRANGKRKYFTQVLLFLLFLSNINKNGVAVNWSAGDEMAFLKNVSLPPEDVECFYIVDSAKVGDPTHIYQLDAFEIATYFSLKTINGYSGQMPDGWEGILDVCSDNYESIVRRWIEKYGLKNVYAYDRAANVWIPCK